MKPQLKLIAYVAGLAVTFAGAFGVGALTGSPLQPERDADRPGDHDATGGHAPAGDQPTAEGGTPAGLQVAEAGYALSPVTAPAVAGADGELSFRILGPDGEPVTEFTESHERDLHLIVVRTDTAEFRHVHPALGADGRWSLDWRWASAGTYKVFADFTPAAAGDALTLARLVEVAGEYAPVAPSPQPAQTAVAEVDGYTATLSGELVAGERAVLTASIVRDGRPVTDLEPYLGAYGHLVVLRQGDLRYVHVHPEHGSEGSEVAFRTEAPTAGTYRLFLEFQVAGQVHLAEFTLTATRVGSE